MGELNRKRGTTLAGIDVSTKIVLKSLTGKTALITAAAGGIGSATAEILAANGVRLFLADSNREALEAVIIRLRQGGYECSGNIANVMSEEEIKGAVCQCLDTYSRIDILCNIAGGILGLSQNTAEISAADWNAVMALNLTSVFLCCREVMVPMVDQGYGRIVNVSSLAGQVASDITNIAYASAKAGIIQFTRHLARELGPQGVAVNAVAPGYTASSPRIRQLWASRNMDTIFKRVALRREATALEQANVIAFLASDEASYITGAVLDVNGGAILG